MVLTVPVTLLVLGAAFMHAAWNALIKAGGDKQLDAYAVAIASGCWAAVLIPFVSLPAQAAWPWLVGSAAVHVLYFLFLAGAYRWGDLSYVYPLMRGGGPLAAALFAAVFIDEPLSPTEWLGMTLISGGIVASARGHGDTRATLYALGNGCVIGAYTLIDAAGARASGSAIGYTTWFFFVNGIVTLVVGLIGRPGEMTAHLRRFFPRCMAGGALSLCAYGIALWAMTQAPVALVAGLREVSVLFAAAIGVVLFKETIGSRRLAALAAMMLGVAVLKL